MGLFSNLGRIGGGVLGSLIPIPGVGSAIGGYLGGKLGGVLDGGGGGQNGVGASRSALADRFATMATGPTSGTPMYQAGRTELNQVMRDQTGADEARLAASGGAGGEAEVALASARGQARASGLTRLFGMAGDRQMQAGQIAMNDYASQQARNDQRTAGRNSLIAGAFSTAAQVLPSVLDRRN